MVDELRSPDFERGNIRDTRFLRSIVFASVVGGFTICRRKRIELFRYQISQIDNVCYTFAKGRVTSAA